MEPDGAIIAHRYLANHHRPVGQKAISSQNGRKPLTDLMIAITQI